MTAEDPFALLGTVVDGRYRVVAVAGHGGHAVVYRAHHLAFDAPIALKVLKLPGGISEEEMTSRLAKFRREGKVQFELSRLHASIVKTFESGVLTAPDSVVHPYLALEWLEGVSLERESFVRQQSGLSPMTLSQVLSLLDGPAGALRLAHARRIVHRDIKPDNLFVEVGGGRKAVRLLDFGIAKIFDDSLTMTVNLAETGPAPSAFTPMYAAPEQWLRRLGATGPWTDVHAWALVVVELLTGRMPLIGSNPAQFMAACLDEGLRPTPRALGVDLGDEVEAVLKRALAVQPAERFREMGEFWAALVAAARWTPAMSVDVELHALARVEVDGRNPTPATASQTSTKPTDTTAPRWSRSLGRPQHPKPRHAVIFAALWGLTLPLAFASIRAVRRTSTVLDGGARLIPPMMAEPPPESSVLSPSEGVAPAVIESSAALFPIQPIERKPSVDSARSAAPKSSSRAPGSMAAAAPRENAVAPAQPRADAGAVDLDDKSSQRASLPPTLDQLIKNEELLHRR